MKEVTGFPMYTLYEDGRVYSQHRHRFLKPVVCSSTGYPLVTLVEAGVRKNKHIHRLLAEAYLPNPDNLPQVNHINGDKGDYSLSNLEWVTARENSQHAIRTELTKERDKSQSYAVEATCVSSGMKMTFDSIMAGSRTLSIPQPNITKVLKGVRKSAGGYFWKLL